MNLLYVNRQISQLQSTLNEVNKELQSMPPGKLISTKNNKKTKWYIHTDAGTSYLPKSNINLAKALAKKRYLSTKKEVLTNEIKALTYYSKHHKDNYQLIYDGILTDTRYASLFSSENTNIIGNNYFPDNPHINAWLNEPYIHNPNHPENLAHKTLSGNIVRSKSEVLIANLLTQRNIPFKYECPLYLNGQCFYPDFTIMNPIDCKIWYLEHLGMMDNPQYVSGFTKKLQTYCSNDIIPDHNLILTYETSHMPLDINALDTKLSYIFGNANN
ncbi:MAG: hypothetical protein KBS96_08150 [Lachnospiraceae bacterium]|nr:hypothetical protein [Candidatus Colinaster scatohippi]